MIHKSRNYGGLSCCVQVLRCNGYCLPTPNRLSISYLPYISNAPLSRLWLVGCDLEYQSSLFNPVIHIQVENRWFSPLVGLLTTAKPLILGIVAYTGDNFD